jgi:hypothetical protein
MRCSHFFRGFLGCVSALYLAGCAHYQLGTEGKLTFQTIYVTPVHDSANVPQATALFTAQIREAFLRDGRVQLANSPESADVTLSIDLRNYDRRVATVQRADTGLARSFDLDLEAVCTLLDNRSRKLLFEKRPITVTREIFTTASPLQLAPNGQPIFVSEQLQAEYQTMPLLAQSLADRVSHAVLDVW